MKSIASINAKGGCGKSTLAVNTAAGLALTGHRTLLIDLDPQAQATQWLNAGDGWDEKKTVLAAFKGLATMTQVIQPTATANLDFVAAAIGLEDFGREIRERDNYQMILARLMAQEGVGDYEYVVIDSPNQISPVMEQAIFGADVFIVPFEGPRAVRSYANFFKLVVELRPDGAYRMLHVLNRLSQQEGLRKEVIDVIERSGLSLARTEVRSCGWLGRVSEHGGNIFSYRPHSNGAEDIMKLVNEILEITSARDAQAGSNQNENNYEQQPAATVA